MTFGDALEYLKKGGNVARETWPPGQYVTLKPHGKSSILMLVNTDCEYYFSPLSAEMLAEDWVLL